MNLGKRKLSLPQDRSSRKRATTPEISHHQSRSAGHGDANTLRYHSSTYTIGLITALSTEFAAISAMLEVEHDKPSDFQKSAFDFNEYSWGAIGKHSVVLTLFPMGDYGKAVAADVARLLITAFPSIRMGILVGIGGGVPRPHQGLDIRLGDVIVSKPTGTTGGVIHYDMGQEENTFRRRGFLGRPPAALLSAVAKLDAQRKKSRKSRVSSIIEDALRKNPGMTEDDESDPAYTYQGFENDRLFLGSYSHEVGQPDCSNCDPTKLISRNPRAGNLPRIHHGLIASGDRVLKNAQVRDDLAKQLKQETGTDCICFEMEAAGLMNNFPCLVVRGVSDYADSHKNDRWQSWAAMTAAAYVHELLCEVGSSEVDKTQEARELMGEIHSYVQAIDQKMEGLQNDQEMDAIKRWLSPPDPSINHIEALQQRQEGTGAWFLSDERFIEWKKCSGILLWLHGIPGCGKTILCSSIIEHLTKTITSTQVVLYFYFDFRGIVKQSFRVMIHSLILQLYLKVEDTRAPLNLLYHLNEHNQPTVKSLCTTFLDMIRQLDRVYVILDALDECQTGSGSQMEALVSWMQDFVERSNNVHLLATSRLEVDIELFLNRVKCTKTFPIHSRHLSNDIESYVLRKIEEDRAFERWRSRPDVQNEIKTALIKKANGMFRWVACQVETLRKSRAYRDVKRALRELPETLDETYARILEKIPADQKQYAIRILQFLVFSERPLRLEEACDVVAVDFDEERAFDPKYRLPIPQEVTAYCSGLITLKPGKINEADTEQQTIIELAHLSVKDYLTSIPPEREWGQDFAEAPARASLARVCLSYLLSLDFSISLRETRESFALAEYSARYWPDHFREAGSSGEVLLPLAKAFFSEDIVYSGSCRLFDPTQELYYIPNEDESVQSEPPLSYAATKGLVYSVQMLLEENAWKLDLDAALIAAAEWGHLNVVGILLDKGANIHGTGGAYGSTSLFAASARGHNDVVQLLIDRGADVCARAWNHDALMAASGQGHTEVVQILVTNGADIHARDLQQRTALMIASDQGHKAIVQILASKGADINAVDKRDHTALIIAAEHGHTDVVEILIRKGAWPDILAAQETLAAFSIALEQSYNEIVHLLVKDGIDVNRRDSLGRTPLSIASERGNQQFVNFLVKNNADIHARNSDGQTPLYIAVKNRDERMIQVLAESGADINERAGFHGTLLRDALVQRDHKMVEILIKSGADLGAKDHNDETPLLLALKLDDNKTVQLLVNKGADINERDMLGRSPLLVALERRNQETVEMLIQIGADVSVRDSHGQNALLIAIRQRNQEMVQTLINKGAEINPNDLQAALERGDWDISRILIEASTRPTKQAFQKSPVWRSEDINSFMVDNVSKGKKEMIEILIENGVDINKRSPRSYRTALYSAALNGHEDIVRILVERGADTDELSGITGNTALGVAAQYGYEDIVQILVDAGADVNLKYGYDYVRTALHDAVSHGQEYVVQILIENGADLSIRDKAGLTPEWLAARRGQHSIVQVFAENRAMEDLTDSG